jgi:alanyl-tRNA synthetase
MKSSEIRQAFLDFYAGRGHEVVPSAPLIPQNDPTLMFVNAGMVQFKDVFTGKERRDYTRACSSQKCIRISGKHNDLENVGVTARHHTFFEMLGNFSFGDYFKEEAIVSAWELLTREFQIDRDRLVVTVYNGEGGFPADDDAAAIWKKVTGWGDDRILRCGKEDNFWSMGDTGPCGPCSEIHFFHGDEVDVSSFGEEPGIDGKGWTEIWNLVFMQFDRAEKDAEPTLLPAPSIDTGAGLERVAAVLQGVTSNYDTDVLRRLVDYTGEIAGKKYGGSTGDDDVSMRVIADHARTTAFLIAEGVLPDKQRREYVLRRVMRRAIRHGHRLGIDDLFLHKVAGAVVDFMADAYPELADRRELIAEMSEGEETRFRATLRRGMKILDERFDELREGGKQELPADVVADLYTTYGFPLDLTEVIAREQKIAVDLAAATVIVKGEEDAEGDIDPTAALDPVYREVANKAGSTTFNGYQTEVGDSDVVALIRIDTEGEGDEAVERRTVVEQVAQGDDVEIVVAETPFYAEAGGQVGDQGTIRREGTEAQVTNTRRPIGTVSLHRAKLTSGALRVGDRVHLEVDHDKRTATRRNHSATHLLHWALKEVLGQHAQQKGSLVGPDTLRFDFAHNQPLTDEEIQRVEKLVNAKVLTNAPVQTDILAIDEARARGAVAIFEEKYGDVVRVLTMTDDSVELCGGTHCHALGDIGLFKIVSEGGTAAGVRRILAATGQNALTYVDGLQDELARARVAAKATTGGDLADKIDKIVQSERQLQKRVAKLEKQLVEGGGSGGGIDSMLTQARTVGDVKVLGVKVADGTKMATLRELSEKLRDKLGGKAVVLVAANGGDKAQLALTVSKAATDELKAGALIKPIAGHVGGSGGGRPDMAQAGGSDTSGIDEAVEAVYAEVESALG